MPHDPIQVNGRRGMYNSQWFIITIVSDKYLTKILQVITIYGLRCFNGTCFL